VYQKKTTHTPCSAYYERSCLDGWLPPKTAKNPQLESGTYCIPHSKFDFVSQKFSTLIIVASLFFNMLFRSAERVLEIRVECVKYLGKQIIALLSTSSSLLNLLRWIQLSDQASL